MLPKSEIASQASLKPKNDTIQVLRLQQPQQQIAVAAVVL